jgi:hypothetical protein
MLVAAGFTLLMAVRVFRDRQIMARWKASLLLVVIFLLLSAFALWQAPFVPEPTISFYYFSANTTLLMSLYPAFFGALQVHSFAKDAIKQLNVRQQVGGLFSSAYQRLWWVRRSAGSLLLLALPASSASGRAIFPRPIPL